MHDKLIAAMAVLALCLTGCGGGGSQAGSAIFGDTDGFAAEPCEGGGIATGDPVAVGERVDLRGAPSANAPLVAAGKPVAGKPQQYRHVDQNMRMRELCRQANWSRIRITDPEGLSNVIGWVPASALLDGSQGDYEPRTYLASDFFFEDAELPYKDQIVTVVNKIVQENTRCLSVDESTLEMAEGKGTPDKPVFQISCNNPDGAFTVPFEPGDATSGKVFRAVETITQDAAVEACGRAANEAAVDPLTTEFSPFSAVAFVPYPNGSSRLIAGFSAKTSAGAEGKFHIECLFDGPTITKGKIRQLGG